MKKYKQLYKYSDCVITNLHIIQHTRWTFFFIHIATMHLTKWKIKKDFFCCFVFFNSFFSPFFFALNTPPMESAVDEVRSFRCTVGSGQDAWWAGPCHVLTEYYKATIMTWSLRQMDSSRTELHRRSGRWMHVRLPHTPAEGLSAAKHCGPPPARWVHATLMQKTNFQMICID